MKRREERATFVREEKRREEKRSKLELNGRNSNPQAAEGVEKVSAALKEQEPQAESEKEEQKLPLLQQAGEATPVAEKGVAEKGVAEHEEAGKAVAEKAEAEKAKAEKAVADALEEAEKEEEEDEEAYKELI